MPATASEPDLLTTRTPLARHVLHTSGRVAVSLFRAGLIVVGVLGMVAALAWALLLFQILPRAAEWRDDLAQQATQALGVPVRLAQVEGRREGLWPVLVLRQVELLEPSGRVALALPEVRARLSLATLSPWAWMDGQFRLGELVFDQPDLAVRRDRQGRFHVAGLVFPSDGGTSGAAPDHRAADWVLTQARIRIERGRVQWHDEWRGAPPVALTDLNLDVRNPLGVMGRRHEWQLQATPPRDVGQRFTVEGRLQQAWLTRPSDWRAWQGTVTADWPQVNVQRWRDHVSLPVQVSSGRGRLGVTLALEAGRVSSATLVADVRGLRMRWQPDVPELGLRRLSGTVTWSQQAQQTMLGWQQLSLELDDGQRWPASDARLSWQHQPLKPQQVWPTMAQGLGGTLTVSRLDARLLASLADRLPLPTGWRTALTDLGPQGVLQDLTARWTGDVSAPSTYNVETTLAGLRVLPSRDGGQRPGLDGATVRLKANEREGQAELAIQQGWLAFPGVFEEPTIPVERLQAQVRWTHQQGQWDVQVRKASFANADAQGTLEARWRTSRPGERDAAGQPLQSLPGWLTLSGRLQQAQATRVWRYLPLTIPPDTRAYVRDAFRSGTSEAVDFEVDGELNAFPFKDDVGGRFRVRVPLRDVTMAYVPPALLGLTDQAERGVWAPLVGLQGLLRFEGQRMLVTDATGRLGTVGSGQFELKNVQGEIANLGDDNPRLTVSGQGKGPLGDALQFLARSPISTWTGHALDAAQAQGQGSLELALDIPLMRTDDTTVKGALVMTEADAASLRLNPDVPWMSALRGRIAFTERDLQVQAQTRVWGEAMAVQGSRGADGISRFNASGRVRAQALAQAVEYPVLAHLAPLLSGEAPVQVTVQVGEARVRQGLPLLDVTIQSSLQGVQSRLPAPLDKPAAQVWPLRVSYQMTDATGAQDALLVDLGNPAQLAGTPASAPWLRAELRTARALPASEAGRTRRGVISLIQSGADTVARLPGLPERGLQAQVVVSRLDVDAWLAAGQQLSQAPSVPWPATTVAGVGPAGGGVTADASWMPDALNVTADTVVWRQRTLRDVALSVAHPSPRVWRAQLSSREAAGQVEWLPDDAAQTASAAPAADQGGRGHKLVARLQRLSIPPAEAEALSVQALSNLTNLSGQNAASSVPALDVVVDAFEWRGLPLGRFEVEAVNRRVSDGAGGVVPEWRLTRFRLGGADAQLNAQGNWTASAAGASRSAFVFTLDVNNGGDLLNRLGLPRTVQGAKGQLSGHVAWAGSPLDVDADSMSGDVKVRLNRGQFLKVDPGAAKLLGVLSLQSLPRRLTLDFRDLFQEGFAFDAIDGDVNIQQGVASTRNLRMRGVQAVVLMEGTANLRTETQDLQVYVVPDVNAGAASLAYAAINPVVGLGTFVAQMLLRKQVSEAGTQAFNISGSWSDPQVTRVLSARELTARSDAAQSPAAAPRPSSP